MKKFLIGLIFLVSLVHSNEILNGVTDSNALRAVTRVYNQCEDSDDILRCLKVQGIKIMGRALKVQNIKLLEGLSVIKRQNAEIESQRSFNEPPLSNRDIENLSPKSLDNIFYERFNKLMDNHQIQVNVPRLLVTGKEETGRLIEEGRKKMKKYLGPFIAAMMLKAGILKMAYHSIAIVAGKALIIGKIALIISAIIGLKKLVTPEGHEKTTYEIVKHPQVQQSHTYSSSHGDYEGSESGGGSYHRSLTEDEMMMQDKAYRAHIPRS